MTSFLALLRRDLLLAMRQGIDALVVILFFLLGGVLFAFVLGPRPELLAGIAPGVVLVMAALAALLALDRMFQSDFEDGSLDQMALAPLPLELAALAKALVHWLVSGLPLLVATPFLSLMLRRPDPLDPALLLALLLATPALSLLGGLGAALTLGARRSGLLLAFLVLPLFVPVLIFAAGAAGPMLRGAEHSLLPLTVLGALDLVLLALMPWATAAALRSALR